MNFYSLFPFDEEQLTVSKQNNAILNCNGHIHTPYSFSAFSSIDEAFMLAKQQEIDILGINDFYVTDGYEEFAIKAREYGVFPLFNVEFMALDKELQSDDIRINDPANPGRIYISGKGLSYPIRRSAQSDSLVEQLRSGTNKRTAEMVRKLNVHFRAVGVDIQLDLNMIQRELAKGLVRERHVAKAVWHVLSNKYSKITQRLEAFHLMFGGRLLSNPENEAEITNEIRNRFLKKGNIAYVLENDDAFISLERAIELIIDSGGIPCYPVLLDDKHGMFTHFESDWEQMCRFLTERGIYCIELIPQRNSVKSLTEFINYFDSRGFSILLGTEHNTPVMTPMSVSARDGELTTELQRIAYRGACLVAAHQYRVSKGMEGYINSDGSVKMQARKHWEQLGVRVLAWYLENSVNEIKLELNA